MTALGPKGAASQAALSRAVGLLQAGNVDAAATLLRDVLAATPEQPDALQLLGLIARRKQDHELAATWFRRSLGAEPRQPHVHNNLGNALLDLGRADEAIKAYGEALRLQPGYGDARVNLGIGQLAAGDAAAAVETLSQAVAQEPRNAKAWSSYGRALRGSGRHDEAIEAFTTSLSLRPGHLATVHNLAVAMRLAGRAEDARPLLEQCAAASPASAEIHYNLGHCYYDLARLEDASAAYRRAIAADPQYRDAHDSLNRLLWQVGDIDQYLQSYFAVLAQGPADPDLIADLANRLNLGGRMAEAIQLIEAAMAEGIDTPALRHRIGQAQVASGASEAGLTHLEAAVSAASERHEFRLELARTQIIERRYDEALAVLGPTLDAEPTNQQAIAYQGLARRLKGDPGERIINDYDRFVGEEILEPPAEWGGAEAFNRRLEAVLAKLHTTSQHPLEQTLRGGTQTMGDLFDHSIPEIAALRRMIEGAVRRFIASLPDDPTHPFLSRKSDDFRFSGSWSVRLRKQGFHVSHVHSEGWISSCYYVGLPAGVANSPSHEGWFKLGETGLGLTQGREAAAFPFLFLSRHHSLRRGSVPDHRGVRYRPRLRPYIRDEVSAPTLARASADTSFLSARYSARRLAHSARTSATR
jgi:tetratricopeptide (TPR) repeat protein